MTKNPFINALCASAYIGIVACIMFYGINHDPVTNKPTVFIPIAILSLFSLSAAIMGCSFFYQPVRLYLDGEKQKAIKLLFSTIGSFAVLTGIFAIVLFLSR